MVSAIDILPVNFSWRGIRVPIPAIQGSLPASPAEWKSNHRKLSFGERSVYTIKLSTLGYYQDTLLLIVSK